MFFSSFSANTIGIFIGGVLAVFDLNVLTNLGPHPEGVRAAPCY